MEDYSAFKKYTLFNILNKADYTKRQTKIVCTIGPACWEVDQLVQMIESGMSVARLNFSHGDHKGHGEVVEKIKAAIKKCQHLTCAIMLDTKGPEIRTGLLKDHKPITLVKGQTLEITTDYSIEGDNTRISCSYQSLPKSVKIGSQILIADGSLSCVVKEVLEKSILVEVLNGMSMGEKKNMNLPGVEIDLPTVTEKDEEDILNFGLKKGIDMIALSFTRKASDIENLRDLMGPRGSHIKIIAKIENQEGLHNYDEILATADGIMVARGDLGMEIPPQKVFVAQKWMIKKANEIGKPIITATQMMESIIKNPRPTRAEASDVANAVLDGTDAVMLSGETANGDYPIIAVDTMAKICTEAELCFDNEGNYWSMQKEMSQKIGEVEALAAAAVQLSFEVKTNCIIAFTEDGLMVRMISKYRPKASILAIGVFESVIKGLSICRGVKSLRVPSFHGLDLLMEFAVKEAKGMNICKAGENVIIVMALTEERPDDNPHNILKIVKVK